MPKVSVIIGIYNCASTLQEALDSLYSQTFQDFDIILCDDGSTDGTLELASQNAEKHDNIILLHNQTNLGLNVTLNRCLSSATGEFIARMDGDDVSLPDRFEKEVSFLDAHPEYAIVSTPMLYFDEDGVFGRGVAGGYEPDIKSLEKGSPFCHAPSMVRKTAFDRVNGYSESRFLIRYEDYDLWTRMFKAGFRGFVLDECLYAMRDDRNAYSRRGIKVRINGIYAHYLAYRSLPLSFSAFLKYSIRVIILGFLPRFVYTKLHKNKMSKRILIS